MTFQHLLRVNSSAPSLTRISPKDYAFRLVARLSSHQCVRPRGNAAAFVREIASLIFRSRQIRRMRNEGSQVRPLRREFRRFFILLCTFILLLIARFGNWQVHAAGVGQLLQNAGADNDILAELDSLMAWASLVPIPLLGLSFIRHFPPFLPPLFPQCPTFCPT